MKVHYDPYQTYSEYDEDEGAAFCSTTLGEEVDTSGNWDYVTCGHCLRQKESIMEEVNSTEKIIVEQMGDMADFLKKEEAENQTA